MVTLIDIISRVVFLIITTVIFAIALLTYKRLRNKKTQLLTIGFGLFFIHGVLSIPELFYNTFNIEFTDSLHLMIDAVALLIILIGVLQD